MIQQYTLEASYLNIGALTTPQENSSLFERISSICFWAEPLGTGCTCLESVVLWNSCSPQQCWGSVLDQRWEKRDCHPYWWQIPFQGFHDLVWRCRRECSTDIWRVRVCCPWSMLIDLLVRVLKQYFEPILRWAGYVRVRGYTSDWHRRWSHRLFVCASVFCVARKKRRRGILVWTLQKSIHSWQNNHP